VGGRKSAFPYITLAIGLYNRSTTVPYKPWQVPDTISSAIWILDQNQYESFAMYSESFMMAVAVFAYLSNKQNYAVENNSSTNIAGTIMNSDLHVYQMSSWSIWTICRGTHPIRNRSGAHYTSSFSRSRFNHCSNLATSTVVVVLHKENQQQTHIICYPHRQL